MTRTEKRKISYGAVTATTRDIGLAVRDALALLPDVCTYCDDEHGDDMEKGKVEIWDIDASDANNLILHLADGQQFTIRIIAGDEESAS